MGAWGAIIMGFFGAVFAAMTLAIAGGASGVVLILPFVVFAALAIAAIRVIQRPGDGVAPSPRAGRVIMWSTIGEGVGLFVAANVVENMGHRALLLPATALVVGLHFLPMAIAIPFRPFLVLGGALLAAAGLGFTLAPPVNGEVAGFAAAVALWIAAALAVRRDARAKAVGS